MLFFLLLLLHLSSSLLATDQIIFVQTLFRHGDRTPTETYPNDVYQEDFWGVPWGELTTRGMQQQFEQGQRLRKLYVEGYGLVNATYNRDNVYIRSADTPRCIQSGIANTAGFFKGSATYPTGVDGWPSDWTPIPVHSVPYDQDRQLEAGVSCPKAKDLKAKRALEPNFLDFLASNWRIIADILYNAGGTYETDFDTLDHIYGTLYVEIECYNLTQPAWVTPEFYSALKAAVEQGNDYIDGAAGFGYPEDTELLKLNAGFLLKEWIANLDDAVNGVGPKYHPYSAHDTIVADVLNALNAKMSVIGLQNPDYASTIVCELWKRGDGQLYVKFLYSINSSSDFQPITRYISGCPTDNDFCPLSTFKDRCQKYIPDSEAVNTE